MSIKSASAIARSVAGRRWGAVQQSRQVLPGIYGFTTAGHGGLVAVGAIARDLPAHAWTAAREAGLVTRYAVVPNGRGHKVCLSSEHYARRDGSALSFEELSAWAVQSGEVWIGEEDCDWATIVAALPESAVARFRPGYFRAVPAVDLIRDAEETCTRWRPEYVLRLLDRGGVA